MSFRDVENDSLDKFNNPEDGVPESWEEESPAESQIQRWEHKETDEVVWTESETNSGSPYAVFYARSSDIPADIVAKGFENPDEAEVEAIKVMEEAL